MGRYILGLSTISHKLKYKAIGYHVTKDYKNKAKATMSQRLRCCTTDRVTKTASTSCWIPCHIDLGSII